MKKTDALMSRLDAYEVSKQKAHGKGTKGVKFSLRAYKISVKSDELNRELVVPPSIFQSMEDEYHQLYRAAQNGFSRASIHMWIGIFLYTNFQKHPVSTFYALKQAVEAFEVSLSWKKFDKFPDRYTACHTQLGNTYRRAANEYFYPLPANECRNKSMACFISVEKYLNRRSERDYPCLSILHAENYTNRAALHVDMKEYDTAGYYYRRSAELFLNEINRFGQEILKYPKYQRLFNIVIKNAYNYLSRFNLEEYGDLLNKIRKISEKLGNPSLLVIGSNDLYSASTEDILFHLVTNLSQDEDIQKVQEYRFGIIDRRCKSLIDQESDLLARSIQILSSAMARKYCRIDQPDMALLDIEIHSNLRASEYFSFFWEVFKSESDYFTSKLARSFSHLVRCLETQTFYIKNDKTGRQRELFLKEILPAITVGNEELDQCRVIDLNYFVSVSRNISDIPKLTGALFSDLQIINQAVEKQSDEDISIITADIIEQSIKRYPEILIIKLDIQQYMDDLLIITGYWNGNKVIYNSHSIPVSSDTINTLAQFDSEFDHSVQLDLNFIDWEKIIPPGFKRVALLPSFYAAGFPWVATGNEGHQLIDIVDDIIWLPGILNLHHHIKTKTQREGTYQVDGANLRFNELIAEQPTKEQLVQQLSKVEEFSYLGHGEHRPGETPELQIGQYTFIADELGEKLAGMKLAEIWACEAGMNRPDIPFGCPVNEPFGLDMKMMLHGVNSAIGTLWRVPELTTRIIKGKYDVLKNEGISPSKALLAAQRWWLKTGAAQYSDAHLSGGVDEFLLSLGISTSNEPSADDLLGPMKANDKKRIEREKKALLDRLKHPHTWAGFRFCGLYEHEIEYIDPSPFEVTEERRAEFVKYLSTLGLNSGFIKTS